MTPSFFLTNFEGHQIRALAVDGGWVAWCRCRCLDHDPRAIIRPTEREARDDARILVGGAA